MKLQQQFSRVFNLNSTKRQSFTTRRRNEILTPSVQARQQSRETSGGCKTECKRGLISMMAW